MWLGNRLRVLGLLCCDGAIAMLCGLAAIRVRFGEEAHAVFNEQHVWGRLLLLAGATMISFFLLDLYTLDATPHRATRPFEVLRPVGQAVGLTSLALALIFYLAPQMKLGRGIFLLSLVLMVAVMSGWRLLAAWVLNRRVLAERVLILGTGEDAVDVAREALRRREAGYEVVGFIGSDPQLVGRSLINPCVLGLTGEMQQVARRHRVNRIVVATGEIRESPSLEALLDLRLGEQLAVEEAASFYERLTGKIPWEQLLSRLVFAETTWTRRLYQRARRLVDLALATVGTAVVSAADAAGGGGRQTRFAGTGLLPAGARRPVWANLQHHQAAFDARRRRERRTSLGRQSRCPHHADRAFAAQVAR